MTITVTTTTPTGIAIGTGAAEDAAGQPRVMSSSVKRVGAVSNAMPVS
jgi:hypothetical protein